jgi:hypothetical protein
MLKNRRIYWGCDTVRPLTLIHDILCASDRAPLATERDHQMDHLRDDYYGHVGSFEGKGGHGTV